MVDSEPLARRAWEKVLQEYGQVLDDQTYARMIGLRQEDSSRLVQETYSIAASHADLARQKKQYFVELRADGIPQMPGLNSLMKEIDRSQIPWAVATSSLRAYAKEILVQLGLAHKCRAIAAGDEVLHGKPAPDIYLLAARRLKIEPWKCLALEDSLPGCQAATAAGMITVAVPGPRMASTDYDFVDYVFETLGDVADELESLMRSANRSE